MFLQHIGVQYIKLKLVKCSIQHSRNHLKCRHCGTTLYLYTQNTAGNLGNFEEILGKYCILGGKSMGSKGLIGWPTNVVCHSIELCFDDRLNCNRDIF